MKNKSIIISLIAAFLCVQLWILYIVFTYPVNGIIVEKSKDNEWVIKSFDTTTTQSQVGLKVGDVVLKVNGKAANDYSSIVKWKRLDLSKTILVERSGIEYAISTKDTPLSVPYDIFPILGEVISIMLAIILYKRIKYSRSNNYLAVVFLNIGLIFMSLGGSLRGDPLGRVLILPLLMLLPVIFLHFLIVFFKEKGQIRIQIPTKFLYFLYFTVLAFFIVLLSFFTNLPIVYFVYTETALFGILFFMFGILVNFYILTMLYWKYRREKTYVSTLIKTVWSSLFFSFSPIIFLYFIPKLLFGSGWIDSLYLGWFILFFPITFAYLIATKRLYDMDLIIRRILFTAAIAAVPSLILVGISWSLSPNELTLERLIIELILFIIVLTYILYSLENITTKLEPAMFPRKYQLQSALKKIAKNLVAISSFRELKDIFLIDIVRSLHVFGGAIVFKYRDHIEIISEGDINEQTVEELITSQKSEDPNFSIFEINRHEEFTSYLIMTQKKTKTLLGLEEKVWLNLIMSYLSMSLENVHLIRKLTVKLQQLSAQIPNEESAGDFIWFRKLMLELQENERVRIATDLHDTTMQDLFFLKDRLVSLLEKYVFQPEDKDQMDSIIDYIDVINANLRQSCFELHPYLLKEIGLVQTIEKLVRFERAVSPFIIHFYSTKTVIIEDRDLESKRHIFRIVQELINNAKKHSQASVISISFSVVSGRICFDYEDDGIGFETLDKSGAIEIGSSGIGMEQMKSRILSLKGHFELETSKGKGMKFRVELPLKEGGIG